MASDAEHHRRGLLKLMMKRPALRARLQELTATNADLLSLCGAFEDATSMLERLRLQRNKIDESAIEEYRNLCEEIEQEIVDLCQRDTIIRK